MRKGDKIYVVHFEFSDHVKPTGKGLNLSMQVCTIKKITTKRIIPAPTVIEFPFPRVELSLTPYSATSAFIGGITCVFAWSDKLEWNGHNMEKFKEDCLFEMNLAHIDDNIMDIVRKWPFSTFTIK